MYNEEYIRNTKVSSYHFDYCYIQAHYLVQTERLTLKWGQMTPVLAVCVSGCVHRTHIQPVSWNSSASLEFSVECMGWYGGLGADLGVRKPGISSQSQLQFINQSGSFRTSRDHWPADSFDLNGVWTRAAACLHPVVVLPITSPGPPRRAAAQLWETRSTSSISVHQAQTGLPLVSVPVDDLWHCDLLTPTPSLPELPKWDERHGGQSVFYCVTGSFLPICCYLWTCFITGLLKVLTYTHTYAYKISRFGQTTKTHSLHS